MEMRNFIVQREIVFKIVEKNIKNFNQMGNIREYIATRNVIGKNLRSHCLSHPKWTVYRSMNPTTQ